MKQNRRNIGLTALVALLLVVGISFFALPDTAEADVTTICSDVTDVPAIECEALATFAVVNSGSSALQGVDGRPEGRGTDPIADVCDRHGVVCTNGHVTTVDVDHLELVTFPEEMVNLTELWMIDISGNEFTTLPSIIGDRPVLDQLYIYENPLTSVPTSVGNLSTLTTLVIINTPLTTLPVEIGNLTNLTLLWLYDNALTTLPSGIFANLNNVHTFSIANNHLSRDTLATTELAFLDDEQSDRENSQTPPPHICNDVTDVSVEECKALVAIGIQNSGTDLQNASGWPQAWGTDPITTVCDRQGNDCGGGILSIIDISGMGIVSLPAEISDLISLARLNVSNNALTALPAEIGEITALRHLNFGQNPLASVPDELWDMVWLQNLSMNDTQLTSLSTGVGNLTGLLLLDVATNSLTTLPDEIGNLVELRDLYIYDNQLVELPSSIANLTNLTSLSLYNNHFATLPAGVFTPLTNVTSFDITNNHISSENITAAEISFMDTLQPGWESTQTASPGLCVVISDISEEECGALVSIGQANSGSLLLTRTGWSRVTGVTLLLEVCGWNGITCSGGHITRLSLGGNELTVIPEEIGALTSMQFLDLSENLLTTLPDEVTDLTLLEEFYMYDNQITSLPTEIGDMASLESFDARDNLLTTLPATFGDLTTIEYIDLSENLIATLPSGVFSNLSNVSTFDISTNKLRRSTLASSETSFMDAQQPDREDTQDPDPIVEVSTGTTTQSGGGGGSASPSRAGWVIIDGTAPTGTVGTDTGTESGDTDAGNITENKRTTAVNIGSLFSRASSNGIVGSNAASESLYSPMSRYEVAEIIVHFVQNVEKKTIQHRDACNNAPYNDLSAAQQQTAQLICDLGIMGIGNNAQDPLPQFRPHDILTDEEMQIIIGRYFTSQGSTSRISDNRKIDLLKLLLGKA